MDGATFGRGCCWPDSCRSSQQNEADDEARKRPRADGPREVKRKGTGARAGEEGEGERAGERRREEAGRLTFIPRLSLTRWAWAGPEGVYRETATRPIQRSSRARWMGRRA